MPMIRYILIFLFPLSLSSGNTSPYFEISQLVQKSYEAVTSLRLQRADSLIEELHFKEPDNMMAFWLENYRDCLTIFISEDPALYENRKKEKKSRLMQVEQGDPFSPYYLHLQAEIHFQWAIVRLKFRDYLMSAWEIKKAYSLLFQNVEMYPEFAASKRTLAIIKALIGMVPDNLQWVVKLVGMEGSIGEGMAEIKEVLRHTAGSDFLLYKETQIVYAYMIAHLEQKPGESWDYIHSLGLRPTENPMECFVLANLAMRAGLNEETLRILENRPTGSGFYPVTHLLFMEGVARLYRLDEDADVSLLKFISQTKGQHYIKVAYQKLAWHALINGSEEKYHTYMDRCKMEGSALLEEDEQALREARYGLVPDKRLLSARLLFDGGYYQEAYNILVRHAKEIQLDENNKIEFAYRMGRICHALKNDREALFYYDLTIETGRYEGDYFACNATLMAGSIWESMLENEKAEIYYRRCLEILPDEYRNSIHQKAKAGLYRLAAKTTN